MPMTRKARFLLASLLLLPLLCWLLLVSTRARPEPRFRITDVGTLGGPNSYAFALNEMGHVSGFSDTSTGGRRPFLWTPEEGMKDLLIIGGNAHINAMNDRDEIVGYCNSAQGIQHAVLWTSSGKFNDLGTLGGKTSEATGINNRGEVVGNSQTEEGTTSGFVWTATDGMRILKKEWMAYDITDAGEILCATGWDLTKPFIYNFRTDEIVPGAGNFKSQLRFPLYRLKDITPTPGASVQTRLLEGRRPVAFGEGYKVTFTDFNGRHSIATVSYQSPFLQSAIGKVSPNKSVFHQYLLAAFIKAHAWMLQRYSKVTLWEDGQFVDLSECIPANSGWDRLSNVRAINRAGQIVGNGTIYGQDHAFLLTPIEEIDQDF